MSLSPPADGARASIGAIAASPGPAAARRVQLAALKRAPGEGAFIGGGERCAPGRAGIRPTCV